MNGTPSRPDPASPDGEQPPIFGSWNRLYAAVLCWLVALILFFYLFTSIFS